MAQLKASVLKNFESTTPREFETRVAVVPPKADPTFAFRFFAPSSAPNSGFNAYIEDDGALASFAETLAWRLGAKRAMVR